MRGLQILARTLSVPAPIGRSKARWQYHPRSDRHSKVACWAILFDLLQESALLRQHISGGSVVFGINHEMRDFKLNRTKNLDLVLCTPGGTVRNARSLLDLAERYEIRLDEDERGLLGQLPAIHEGPVGTVHCAVEAKACMTEHMKARPRLYDELNSSHQTIHGSSDMVIAVAFAMVNISTEFNSPGRHGQRSIHRQPNVTVSVIEKLEELPRRIKTGQEGFDAMAIVVVECRNDGQTPVRVVDTPPAPPRGDIFHYESMVRRVAHLYDSRFPRA